MSVSVTYAGKLTIADTLSAGVPDVPASAGVITHSSWNVGDTTFSGSTSPAVSAESCFQKALSTGTATIDLTSLTGPGGGTVDFTGLQVQFAVFQNPITNANPISVTGGASNGYTLNGSSWKETIRPGGEVRIKVGGGGTTVDSTHKTIDLAGTGSQALNVQLVAG